MAVLIAPQQSVNDLWLRAVKQLPDEDRSIIGPSTSDNLNILVNLHADAEKYKQKSLDSRWTYTRKDGKTVILRDVIEKIVRWVDTFKQVGDVAVQYDPAHASLPWAAIRFVLQVAVEDTNKFASVVEDLARIAELICRYAVTEALYLHGTSEAVVGLDRALVKMYTSILEYLSKAKKYFKERTAKRVIKSAVLANTQLELGLTGISTAEGDVRQWKSLVDRNDNIRNFEELEAILQSIDEPLRRIDDNMKNIQDDLQVSKRAKILEWLSREPYMQHHKQATHGVLAESGKWLLSDPIFKEWRDESASSILWLHGIPGSGKSKLVSIVIEDMLKSFRAGNGPHPVFFYCSRNPAELARSNPRAILASLARQLSSTEAGKPLLRPTLDLFQIKEMESFASGQLLMDESCQLIMSLIELYPQTTIILDAMDECDPMTRQELLQALEHILRDSSSLVKIFISSRDDQDIVWHLETYPNLEISSQRNSDDIARFVRREVETLVLARKLLRHSRSQAEMKELIIKTVTEGATGMFRWASLQLQYLCEFKMDADVRTNLGRLPPNLQTLYMEIYDRLSTRPGKLESTIFKNALLWLLCAQRTLRTSEFLAAISIDPTVGGVEDNVSKDLVLEICNNFVVFDSQLDTFRFAHLSVREFLERQPEYSSSVNNCLVGKVCLWAVLSISKNLAPEELLLRLNWPATAEAGKAKDFLMYADIYWAIHCKFAGRERSLDTLKEALSTLLYIDNATSSILLWADRIRTYFRDMDWNLIQKFRDTVPSINSPCSSALFISCVFDFHEQVERIMGRYNTAVPYVNRTGCGPMQVAARYGSCATLAALLSQEKVRIGVGVAVLEEAARSAGGTNTLTALLDERGQEIWITEDVVKAAATNDIEGVEVMTLLLDRRGGEIYITEDIVKAVATNHGNGKAIMALLLNRRGQEVQITKDVIELLVRTHGNGIDLMRLLLDQRGEEFKVTEEVVEAVACNSGGSPDMMALLLERRREEVKITEAVVKAAAGNYSIGLEIMQLLLHQRGDEVYITEAIMKQAAKNFRQGKKIIELLLDQRGEEIRITEEIVEAAAANFFSEVGLLTLLLDRRGEEARITEEMVKATAGSFKGLEVMEFLLRQRGEEVHITEEIMKAAAGNYEQSKDILGLLLDQRGEEISITEEIVEAAASNSHSGIEALTILLDRRGEEIYITEKMVKAAAMNRYNGKKMMELLLEQRRDEVQITDEIVSAAAEWNTEEAIAFLLNRCGKDVKITENVMKGVARNHADSSMEIMRLLLDQRGEEVQITEQVTEEAVRNSDGSVSLMTLLLDQRGNEIKITEAVVKAAAANSNSGKEIMTLLLDRRGEEVRITEEVIKAAAENTGDGVRVMRLLLDRRGEEVHVTNDVMRSVGRHSRGKAMVELLLDRRGNEIKITEAVVKAAARNYGSGRDIMAILLDRRGEEVKITEDVVKAAAKNSSNGSGLMTLLLDQRGEEVQTTEEVIKSAAGNFGDGMRVMTLLLDRRGKEVRITEEVIKAVAGNFVQGVELMKLLLDREGEEIRITEEVIKVAVANNSVGVGLMTLLLDRCGEEIHATEEVVTAAAMNSNRGKKIVELLLDKRGEEITITEGVVIAVAGNRGNGKETMTLLLDRRGDEVKITEKVLKAAAENRGNGKELMTLFLSRRGEEVKITEEVARAAAGNVEKVIQYLYRATDMEITDGVIESAAARGRLRILRLFDQWSGTVVVSQHWVRIAQLRAAAEEGNTKVVHQLIDQHVPLDTKDAFGTTPLWHAAARGKTDVVRVLLATNAVDVNVESIHHRTALFWAASNGNIEVVELLLSHGARQDYVDEAGMSPLAIAQSNEREEVAEILSSNLAKVPTIQT